MNLSRCVHYFSAGVLVFIAGITVSVYQWFPYAILKGPLMALKSPRTPAHFLHNIRYSVHGVQKHEAGVAGGVVLLSGWWRFARGDWKPGLRLINANGTALHQWTIDPLKIWPENPHHDPFSPPSATDYVHGSYLLPNGDIIFNIEYRGLQRIDACGRVVWKLPYRTHHSVERDDDESFWVVGVKPYESEGVQRATYPGIPTPFPEDTALHVSPDGIVLEELNLLSALWKNGYQELVWRYRLHDFEWRRNERTPNIDLVHTNKVTPLRARMAAHFPMFRTGDLLVSMREINTVFVIDRGGRIKWLNSTAFLAQHDAQFEPDGNVVALNNRNDGTEVGEANAKGSTIEAVNPRTGVVAVLYPNNSSSRFYTPEAGKHQLLSNGNRLITEAFAGRVFEVSAQGTLVWEWIQEPYDAQFVPEIIDAARYESVDEASVRAWRCHDSS